MFGLPRPAAGPRSRPSPAPPKETAGTNPPERSGWPSPAVREWRTGECWLCDAAPVPVLWLGPVKTDTGAGPLFACEPCIRHLAKRVLRHHMNNDQAPPR